MKVTWDSPGRENETMLLVLAGFHQLLLDALGHLARHFLGGGARPQLVRITMALKVNGGSSLCPSLV
jgi:hypothetical protein